MSTTGALVGDRAVTKPRLGLFSVGLQAYWDQFPGLLDQLEGYRAEVERRLSACGADVVSVGMVDTPAAASVAGEQLRAAGVDLVVCHVATYATSAQVVPVFQRVGVPVLVLNLQPSPTLDYEHAGTGEWLSACTACSVPELANAMQRAGIPFRSVSGLLFERDGTAATAAWESTAGWVDAASVLRSLRQARFGFLGHPYPGMLDMYTDLTQISAQLGLHVEILEVDDLVARVASVAPAEVEAKRQQLLDTFDLADPNTDPIAAPVEDADLDWAARVAAGLDRLVADFGLDALAYYHRGVDGNDAERTVAGMIPGLALLTAEGVPCSGEADIKNAVAMFVLDRLGAGGSFTEIYAMDFDQDVMLLGHDGPAHLAITDERPTLRKLKLYHGKAGFGVSVECSVRRGPVTCLGVGEGPDRTLQLVVAEGEVEPGPTLSIGNTNSRVRFPGMGPGEWVDAWSSHGPTHHLALGTGHQLGRLNKVADLLGLPLREVGA